MKKLAVVISGWHFPLHFFKAVAEQKIPDGWSVDLFCVSHRDPKYSAEEKEKHLADMGWSYPEALDRILYEKFASISDLEKMGWVYMARPNTIGDWGNTNQWLEEYDYKKYDAILASHDDNLILSDRMFVDLLSNGTHDDWLILTNSNGVTNWKEFVKVKILHRAIGVRGSFEFLKPELLDLLGGKFDLSGVTLTRENETYASRDRKLLNNWNMTVVPMRKFLDQNNLAHRVRALSAHYRVSKYCIEGERGFISSVHKNDKKIYASGLKYIQRNG